MLFRLTGKHWFIETEQYNSANYLIALQTSIGYHAFDEQCIQRRSRFFNALGLRPSLSGFFKFFFFSLCFVDVKVKSERRDGPPLGGRFYRFFFASHNRQFDIPSQVLRSTSVPLVLI